MAVFSECIVDNVILGEEDVPGSRLPHDQVETNSVIQLRRWLCCRGVKSTGKKEELVERVKNCMSTGHTEIDLGVDDGKWYRLKIKGQEATTSNKLPVAPEKGWDTFSKVNIPECFNYGHAYHYFVETLTNVTTDCLGIKDDNVQKSSGDLHIAKPLKRGETYYKSGNVTDIQDVKDSTNYYVRAKVYASFKSDTYCVHLCLSENSGFIINGSCTCKASALGRCSHIAALVFALLQAQKDSSDSCTSKKCTWNTGQKKRKCPKSVHECHYDSYKKTKSNIVHFDPRPPSQQGHPTTEDKNTFIRDLRSLKQSNTMWQTILSTKYSNYHLTSDDRELLKRKGCHLLASLKVQNNLGYPVKILEEQGTDTWYLQRRLRITASDAKLVKNMKSQSAIENYVRQKLWGALNSTINSSATSYGAKNEDLARSAFEKHFEGHLQVIKTGFWVHPDFPEIGCSPDGLICDDNRGENKYGLLEIKCPYSLRDHKPEDFNKVFTRQQLSSFCLEEVANHTRLKRNHGYYYQVQCQMGVTGLKWTFFVVWTPKGLFYEEIEFDSCLWKYLSRDLVSFHHTYLCPEFFEMRLPRHLPIIKLENVSS